LFWFFFKQEGGFYEDKGIRHILSQYFHSFTEKDAFGSIQMNCHCVDYVYKSVTVSAFTKRSVEGNKLIACISYFGQLKK